MAQGTLQGNYHAKLTGAFCLDFLYVFWKTVVILLLLGLILSAILALFLFARYGSVYRSYAEEADQIVENSKASDFRMDEITYIYAANGQQLAELSSGDGKSLYLKYEQIPRDAIDAFVAIEDRSYWRNIGIDVKGIVRVLYDYLHSGGESKNGASTITQQLSRTIYLTRERSIQRKIKEMMVAIRLTKKYTKEEILEFYINTACFSNGIYGLEAAARAYFDKSAAELSLSQITYLCAIPNYPEYYNPYKHPKRGLKRRNKILGDMLDEGYLNKTEYETAKAEKIEISTAKPEFFNYQTTYAVSCAVKYLMKLHGFEFRYDFDSQEDYEDYQESYESTYDLEKASMYASGYEITTSLELDAQDALQQALDSNLAFATEVNADTEIFALQGAVTAIDNATGKVIALVGGRSQENLDNVYSLNRAFQAYRQPGSTIKPIVVYTPALMKGYAPESTVYDISVTAAMQPGANIKGMTGNAMTLRSAVENSRNGVAYSVFNDIGADYGLSFLADMGFDRIVPSDHTMSAALGGLTYGVTTVQMASAYSTLVNQGEFHDPGCITSMKDSDGKELYKEEDGIQVYSPEASGQMVDIMKGVLTEGTAVSMKWSESSDLAAAGKTGTTNDSKDGWFCGVTPYYTVSVWVGYDTPRALANLYGATYPAAIWKDAMLYLTRDLPPIDFNY